MALQSWLERLEVEPDGSTKPYEIVPKDFQLHLNTPDKEFPHCCEEHLVKYHEIKVWAKAFLQEDDAEMLARKTLLSLAFTESYIIFSYNKDDWYEDISDFIEFNIFSFGSTIYHAERYLLKLIGFLKSIQAIDYDKIEKLSKLTLIWWKNSAFSRDLLHLRRAFDKWFHSFPFELSLFTALKDKYDLFFGIVNDDFIEFDESAFMLELNKLTDVILYQHNTSNLYKQGLLTDPSKLKFELVTCQRSYQLNSENLYGQDSDKDPQYRKMIHKWFEDERKYLDEIISLGISNSPGNQPPLADMYYSAGQSRKDELSAKTKLGNTENSKTHAARQGNKSDGYTLNQICIALFCMHLSKESPDAKIILKKYYGSENPASLKNHNIVSKSQFISIENLDKDKWKKDDLQKVVQIVTSENHAVGIENASQYWREFRAAYTKHYKTDND